MNRLTLYSRKQLKSGRPFCTDYILALERFDESLFHSYSESPVGVSFL